MAARTAAAACVSLAVVLASAGCSVSSQDAAGAPTATSVSAAPSPTPSEAPAVASLRTALEASLDAMRASGMTETWTDAAGTITLVQVFDPATGTAVVATMPDGQAETIDPGALLPHWLLDDLDVMGFVESPDARTFIVTDSYGDATFTATYTLDDAGRIGTVAVAGQDVDGTADIAYELTAAARELVTSATD